MLILTDRELEFLASFKTNWSRLYGNELARLLKEGGQQPMRRPRRPSRRTLDPEQSGKILTLAGETRACGKVLKFQPRHV
jgi:hypothetical protein